MVHEGLRSVHPTIHELLGCRPVLLDGAWGTELQALGLEPDECPDTWNVSHPERVEQVARRYVEAGSRVILTNTFRANRIALAPFGLADRTEHILRAGVMLSRRAARENARVFASVGPSGRMLAAGDVTEAELHAAFAEAAETLADADADGIVVETMTDLDEARIAVAAAHRTGLPVVASLVFDSGRQRDHTMMGNTPEQAAEQLVAAGASVIGANCGLGVSGYLEICRRLVAASDRPVWIKPNAGLPEVVNGRIVYRILAREFAEQAARLVEIGASFVGGCCGTTPAFIEALAERMPS